MNETIYFKSPLGLLKMTSEDDFLTGLFFASTEKNGLSEADLKTTDTPLSSVLKTATGQLNEYFAGTRMAFGLPLKQKGTDFQQKVWKGLMEIRAGQPVSYQAFSKNLGDIKAIRAVGTANGKNNISIIVPCHRVIGSNGSLVGYGGDLWRKKWLLEHEAKYCNGVQVLF